METKVDELSEIKSETCVCCAYDAMVKVEDLKHHPKNPNRHPAKQIDMLAKIIVAQGWRCPITVSNLSGFIIRGHGRLMAAIKAGLKVCPVDYQDYDSEAMEMADLLADNKIAELAEMDMDVLKDVLVDLDLLDIDMDFTGFDQDDIDSITDVPEPEPPIDTDPRIDMIAELREKWDVKPGQLWELGKHRLICGDCTDNAVVDKLMNGKKADMVFTDPPYGIGYEGGGNNVEKRTKLEGDRSSSLYHSALQSLKRVCKKTAPMYIWFSDSEIKDIYNAVEAIGYKVRAMIIWNKLKAHFGAFTAQYMQKHEPCLYIVKGNPSWIGATNEVTVWDHDQPRRKEHHPTQKPLVLAMRAIGNHDALIVIDWFLGSGTTILACDQLERICYAIEIDPGYVAVALQRWEDTTGDTPVLVKAK